jgi:hypothetical protein
VNDGFHSVIGYMNLHGEENLMEGTNKSNKRLFICTKPYQYMIARLIKEGCGFEQCDILILNHFYDADFLSNMVRDSGVWNKVMFFEDGELDQNKLKLNPVKKYYFYRSWRKFLPSILDDISEYSELFLAHDFVAVEYAALRYFSSKGKRVTIFEEGFGNYINNSTHVKLHMKFLKRISPWLGLPGGYIGSLKWVDSVWVQRPEVIIEDKKNKLRHKVKHLPLKFKDFLRLPAIIEELNLIYPELKEIGQSVQGMDVITVILTESWHDYITDRDHYIDQMVEKVTLSINDANSPIFIKQHPGETRPIETNYKQISIIPKKIPIELLYLIMMSNKIQRVNLFSFGSTAILNIYDLCRNDENLDIYLLSSMPMTNDYKILFKRFCELATNYHVRFTII